MTDRVWDAISKCAAGFGYELVDLEHGQGGLLRVFIDISDGSRLVSIEDCEALSNQLVHQLPVEGIEFERLEVSSPGFDRRLRRDRDFERFEGERIRVKLRHPVGNRRNFEGPFERAEGHYRLVFEGPEGKEMVLDFELNDVDEARLVPNDPWKEKRR